MEDCAKVAAKWWADRIRNVEPSKNIELFEEELAEVIMKETEKEDKVTISSDNSICRILSDVAKDCGVDFFCFPWKTLMRVSQDKVTVRCGYGARPEVIFGQ